MWTQYMLGSEERWPLNGSLNYYTISQLEMFCKRAGKRDKIPYVGAFMLLHQEEKESEGCHLMVQWSERKHKEKPVLRGKRKKKWEWGHVISKLNPPTQPVHLPSGRAGCPRQLFQLPPPPPPVPPTDSPPPVSPTPGDQIQVSMVIPRAQGHGLVSPSKTQQGTQFGPGPLPQQGNFPYPDTL